MKSESQGIHPELRYRIEEVALQCRSARALRAWLRFGIVAVGATLLATLLLYLAPAESGSATAILGLYAVALGVAAWKLLWQPLRRPITLQQVARYIDEHHPELEDRIVSALEFGAHDQSTESAWIIERFLEETVPLVRKTSFDDMMNPTAILRMAAGVSVLILLTLGIVIGFNRIWFPSLTRVLPSSVAPKEALPFTVEPGDVRIRRGDNQMVWVRSDEPDRVVQVRWREGNGVWRSSDAGQSTTDKVYYHLFKNVQKDIQYQIQFGRRRSEVYQIATWIPPEVESIDLTYYYPDYVKREPREVPNSGNIAAIEGTDVEVAVAVNKTLQSAELVLESGKRLPLERRANAFWSGRLPIERDDEYHVALVDEDGAESEYNPKYSITAYRDKAPEIKIQFPRGDSEVTMLEEVPFDFQISDDYGLAEYGLQYEVIGQDPIRVALYKDQELIEDAKGHHDLMLETLPLEVGDSITWTIYARDTKPDRTEFESLGDPYFLDIRPFQRIYRESISGGGGGAGAGGQQEDELIQQQRDIIIATWNLRRELRYVTPEEFEERITIIRDAQQKVQANVSGASGMLSQPSPEMVQLKEILGNAVDALERAEYSSPKAPLSEATRYQQQAYRLLLKMQPDEAQVQQMPSQGGGGGGGGQRPDITELELDRNRNFYEQENLTQQQQQATDEILNKIKQLAQRQASISDEISKLISEMEQAKTQEEKDEIQRKLERLQEELAKNLENLDSVQQDLSSEQLSNEQTRMAQDMLERARRQMNRSLEQMQQGELQQARSASTRAMDELDDIQEQLEQLTRRAASERLREMVEQMESLADRQRERVAQSEQSLEYHQSPSLEDQEAMDELKQQMAEEREQLERDFVDLMEEAGELSERSRQTQELMARKLGDWVRQTAREGILEDMEEVERYFRYDFWETVVSEEERIAKKMDDAAERLQEVARHLVEDDVEGMQKALEHLDKLAEQIGGGEQQDEETAQRGGAQGEESQERAGDEEGQEGRGAPQESQEGGEGEQRQRMAQRDEEQQGSGRTPGERQEQPQGGQGQSEQQEQGQSDQEGESRGGQQEGSERAGTRSGSPWGQYGGPGSMRDFIDSGYQDWLEELRNAEALLPDSYEVRTELQRIREQIEAWRRVWRDRRLSPQFDLFLEYVASPLANAQAELQREIERRLHEREFVLTDEGQIPERYRKFVSEYFKELAEAEGRL